MKTAMIALASLAAASPADVMEVSARVEAGQNTHHIVLTVGFQPGYQEAGIPAPILQIDVPPSASLTGRILESYRELAKNEFLQEPYERLVKESPARIGFTLDGTPGDNERFGLNIVAYVTGAHGDDARFVRRRFEIAPTPGAEATEVSPPTRSHWGTGNVLQIGDRAEPFTLPRADGSKLALRKFIGKKNVIVTTYRAFW